MKFSSSVMKLSNLLKKDSLNPAAEDPFEPIQKTKTIDLPPLKDTLKVDLERLARILEEDEKERAAWLADLKMQVNSEEYEPDSQEVAESFLDYYNSPKKSES